MEHHATNIYDDYRDEADKMADYDKEMKVYACRCYESEMVEIAKRNAKEVGLSDIINFSVGKRCQYVNN